jgi:hypothetical protein
MYAFTYADILSLSKACYHFHLVCCLESLQIRIFNQLTFSSSALRLLQVPKNPNTTETLSIKVDCGHLDRQLSSVAQT